MSGDELFYEMLPKLMLILLKLSSDFKKKKTTLVSLYINDIYSKFHNCSSLQKSDLKFLVLGTIILGFYCENNLNKETVFFFFFNVITKLLKLFRGKKYCKILYLEGKSFIFFLCFDKD